MRTAIFAATLALASAGASAAGTPSTDRQAPDRAPSTMTSKEIAAFNQGLDRQHPYYIRCRKDEVIGSLVKKLRVCRTNQEWARYSESGNQDARDTVEAMTKGGTNNQ